MAVMTSLAFDTAEHRAAVRDDWRHQSGMS
jgi:hypothetical protein